MDLHRFQCYSLPVLVLLLCFCLGMLLRLSREQTRLYNNATDYPDHLLAHSYAVLVSTNLVPQKCSCGVCDPSRNIAVPEHINSIGHDLRIEVSTNYLPIVHK